MRRPPYSPFLAGPPAFQPALKPIEEAAWLAPDVEAAHLADKRVLMRTRRGDVFGARPETAAAQAEVLGLVAGAGFAADVEPWDNSLLDAAARVSDDLCVLASREGAWRLDAAVACAPTYWSLAEVFGGTLAHLHGPVPDRLGPNETQALAPRIGRMFDALAPGVILERFNWTVQAGPDRFTPDGAPLRARAEAADPADALDLLHLRVERQTVRKLPNTGAVLFTIRISLDPLRAVLAEAEVKAAFAIAWRDAPEHVRVYKKWAPYERLVVAALEN